MATNVNTQFWHLRHLTLSVEYCVSSEVFTAVLLKSQVLQDDAVLLGDWFLVFCWIVGHCGPSKYWKLQGASKHLMVFEMK